MSDFSKLRDFFDSLEEADINLCGIEVRQGHDILLRHFAGYADAEKQVKLGNDHLYWLFSCS